MQRNVLLLLFLTVLTQGCSTPQVRNVASNEKQLRRDEAYLYEQYITIATRLIPRLWPEMDWSPDEIPPIEDFRVITSKRIKNYRPSLSGQRVWMNIGVDSDTFLISNMEIRSQLKELRGAGERPTLTINQAIARADEYLRLLEYEIPDNFVVSVRFVFYRDPIWVVQWRPSVNGILFDNAGNRWKSDLVAVEFHERLGLQRFNWRVGVYPEPKSMDVHVSPEVAARTAAPLAKKIMHSGYFRGWHGKNPERTLSEIMDTRLVIYEPNWIFSPLRSIFLKPESTELPKETRLCWRVTFVVKENTTRGGLGDEPNIVRIIHDSDKLIWIYIDAASGRCVGADYGFSE